jgi:hypothetical protein
VRKREAILEATNFNVTGAIEINHLAQVENKPEVKTRRSAPLTAEEEQSAAPVRRTAAPSFKLKSDN